MNPNDKLRYFVMGYSQGYSQGNKSKPTGLELIMVFTQLKLDMPTIEEIQELGRMIQEVGKFYNNEEELK